jgi:hypothetical protein
MEERVAREDDSVAIVLHEEADAVPGVTWRIQTLHLNGSHLEGFAVLWRSRNSLTVLAADDLQIRRVESSSLDKCC